MPVKQTDARRKAASNYRAKRGIVTLGISCESGLKERFQAEAKNANVSNARLIELMLNNWSNAMNDLRETARQLDADFEESGGWDLSEWKRDSHAKDLAKTYRHLELLDSTGVMFRHTASGGTIDFVSDRNHHDAGFAWSAPR